MTEPRFKFLASIVSEVELPSYVTSVQLSNHPGECAYKIPRDYNLDRPCHMIMVNPTFPRQVDNMMGIPLLFAGHGYAVSGEWLKASPLHNLKGIHNLHILSGVWDEAEQAFIWYGSGLNLQSHLLLRFDAENSNEALNTLAKQLRSKAVCSDISIDKMVSGLTSYTMIVPLAYIADDGVICIDREPMEHLWDDDKLWKRAQLENFRLQLDYDCIDNGCKYQHAWLIDEHGNEVPAEMVAEFDERMILQFHLHWPNVRIGDFCIFFHEEPNPDGLAESDLSITTGPVGIGAETVWQIRKQNKVAKGIAEKLTTIDPDSEPVDDSDMYDAMQNFYWNHAIKTVDEIYNT